MDFDKAREEYEMIPIPEELSMRVDKAIKDAQNNRKQRDIKKERKMATVYVIIGSICLIVPLILTILNIIK